MLLPLSACRPSSLPPLSFQTNEAHLSNLPCSKTQLRLAIDALTPPESQTVYLHGSNSASLTTFSAERPDALRGCLLSLSELKSESLVVESGEHSSPLFAEAYGDDHQGVSAYRYQSGWNEHTLDDVDVYCGYNCSEERGRYPVLFVISEHAEFKEVGYGESQCSRITPEHLLGILVPGKHLANAMARVAESGLNVVVASLSD